MKHIDETQLLLAVGEVGDDLLERAERPRRNHRPSAAKWGALAACFVLIAVLGVPNVLDSFRMGSSGQGADNGQDVGQSMEENKYESAGAAENGEGDKPENASGEAGVPSAGDGIADQAFPENGPEGLIETNFSLHALGITGISDITGYSVTETKYQSTAAEGEPPREETEQYYIRAEAPLRTGSDASSLYWALAMAGEVLAAEDTAEPSFTETVWIVLASGATLEGQYDPGLGLLKLGDYHFYSEKFSDLFEEE